MCVVLALSSQSKLSLFMHKIIETIIKTMVMVEAENLELVFIIRILFFHSNHDIFYGSTHLITFISFYLIDI